MEQASVMIVHGDKGVAGAWLSTRGEMGRQLTACRGG